MAIAKEDDGGGRRVRLHDRGRSPRFVSARFALSCAALLTLSSCVAPEVSTVPAPAPAPARETPIETVVPFAVILFSPGSDRLDARAAKVADSVAAEAASLPEARVIVIGHADRRGTPASNMDISVRRAGTVGSALVSRGVEVERIEILGRGETEPAVPTADGVAEPANRRAEIIIRSPAPDGPISSH